MTGAASGAGERTVVNSLSGFVAGPVVQAGTVNAVHFHARWDPVVPAQLPAASPVFSGRERELAVLDECAARDDWLPLAVISGPGGIGKTALALHWLHRRRADFPGGQLYADLGAFDQAGPVASDTVLQWFLVAMGVPPDEVPETQQEREAAFRSLTVDKAVAVLLDNAVSAKQVQPLLPATTSGIVVVASRWRLAGLAVHGQYLELSHFDAGQSLDVLSELLGKERVSREEEAAARIAVACAGLPIALSMVAARLRTRPRRSLTHEAVRLEERSRLLRVTSEDSSLGMVFDASVDNLPAGARYVYRLCGLHPGERFGSEVIIDVADRPEDVVEEALEKLVDSNLLIEDAQERFRFHDLVKAHAAGRAREGIPDLEHETLRKSFVEWYLTMTVKADAVVHPHRWRASNRYANDSLPHRRFNDRDAAINWLEQEQRAVRSARREAVRNGWDELVWEFAEALWGFFLHHRHYDDWIDIQEDGIEAAERLGERLVLARLRSQLGYALAKLGRYREAIGQNEAALRLGKAEGDQPTIATAISQLGRAARGLGDWSAALGYYRQAAEIQQRAGIPRGVALSRRRAGEVFFRLGRFDEAITELQAAARAMADLDDQAQYARTLMVLGPIYAQCGRDEEGVALLHEALAIVRSLSSPHYTAEALLALGDVQALRGNAGEALEHFSEAKELYESMRDPRADEAASRIRQVANTDA